MTMKILEICADTRQGARELNEDSFVLLQEGLPENVLALSAVADGIGGQGNGHVASSTALTTVVDIFRKLARQYSEREEPPVMDWLSFCFQKANATLLRMGLTMDELRGMGTTCTAAAITRLGKLYVCHVGDSRAYLYRDNHLTQITEDDWFRGMRDSARTADRADSASARNKGISMRDLVGRSSQPAEMTLVTQAVGWQPLITSARSMLDLRPQDTILLCTDGLTDNLNTEEMEQVMGDGGNDLCARLVDSAAGKPGSDNATVAVIRVGA